MKSPNWSKDDLKWLRYYAKNGYTAKFAAHMLDRPYIATRVKASEKRIRFGK